MLIENKRLMGILLTATFLLLLPLIAMQFSTEVDWSPFDFAIAAVLLYGFGLLGELVWRGVRNRERHLLYIAILGIVLLLIWAELAVGVLGTPFAGS